MLATAEHPGLQVKRRGRVPVAVRTYAPRARRLAPGDLEAVRLCYLGHGAIPGGRHGLGAGIPQVSTVSSLVASGAGLVSAAASSASIVAALPFIAAAGPAAPFVALGAGIVALVSKFIGGGCGQTCIKSAEAEQVYEVAADLVYWAAVWGMITPAAALTGLQAILQAGSASLQQLQQSGDPQAANGLTNMTKALDSAISQTQNLAPAPPIPLNLSQLVSQWLTKTNAGGWYASSLTSGEQMAEQIIPALVTAAVNATAATASPYGSQAPGSAYTSGSPASSGLVPVASSTFSVSPWVLGGIGVLLLLWVMA
jgi:hypothetical protein